MSDQNDLLKAIRVIVREEVRDEIQPIKDNVTVLREDVGEVKQRLGKLERRMDHLETKVDDMPEQLVEMIAAPLIQENQYQAERLDRLEKHNHLPPLPRPE